MQNRGSSMCNDVTVDFYHYVCAHRRVCSLKNSRYTVTLLHSTIQCRMHNVECGVFSCFWVGRVSFLGYGCSYLAAKWHRYCVYQKKAVSLQCIMRNNAECIMYNVECIMQCIMIYKVCLVHFFDISGSTFS